MPQSPFGLVVQNYKNRDFFTNFDCPLQFQVVPSITLGQIMQSRKIFSNFCLRESKFVRTFAVWMNFLKKTY